jgi:twitching motility protein PilT
MKQFKDMILAAVKEGFSDLHITGNQPLVYRKNGIIFTNSAIRWSYQEVDDIVRGLLTPMQLLTLRNRWSVDFAFSVQHARVRMNVFNTIQGLSLAVRILPGTVPSISMLNLHPSLQQICELNTGLILICGTTGSGKTTTIAAIIDEINRSRSAHIVTLEDPIEFRFVSRQSFIEQREVGTHVPSFRQGLIDVLREDPDVIVVGEIREPEEIRLTLGAAESGHLVIATLHAARAEDAIYRICNSFPPEAQEEIRFQLASTLSWIIIQHLVYMEKLKFRVPHLAILRGTQSVKGLIRENKLHQIENAMHTGKRDGMFTMERYLGEFLNTSDGFIHPIQSFRPTPEAMQEITYVSPLIGAGSPWAISSNPPPTADHQKLFRDTMMPSPLLQNISGSELHYIIDENENLEDLITELGKSGP